MLKLKSFSQLVNLGLIMATSIPDASAMVPAPSSINGTWFNPDRTVAVRTGDCAGRLCGWISWASPEALQDAKDSGIERLIGTELLQDYRAEAPSRWRGTVYVPDLGHSFSSRITQLSPNELKISGCLLGRFVCKSQVWRKIA